MENKILSLILIFENWISKETLYFSEKMQTELTQIKEENSLILFYSWFKKNKVIFAGLDSLEDFNILLGELYNLNQKLFNFQYVDFLQDLISYNLYYAGYNFYDLKEDLKSNELSNILSIIKKDVDSISDDIRCLKRADAIKSNIDVDDDY